MRFNFSSVFLFLLLSFFSILSAQSSSVNGGSIVLSATAQAIPIGSAPVQAIRVSVIPGYCGKVFIGTAAMNTATYAGVVKVLFPNCNGGHSEEYRITDESGQDGIQPNTLYVIGQIAGERVLWESVRVSNPAAQSLVPVQAGFLAASGAYAKPLYSDGTGFTNSTYTVARIDATVIPGMVGKVRIGHMPTGGFLQPDATYTSVHRVLFPNSGNTGQNNAHSEHYTLAARSGANTLVPGILSAYAAVYGEGPLVTLWRRQ